ncbi:hypothetical protein CEXT_427801 [Caerostris extrusa]|uniref:Uncharacterized protein n=1 Tax=Caerostris extrusa TaxID=172846 RepID=A0AAV4XEL8_CAEEX|nr:hypothetical protein CEXT_427801 [Caerostris extrusa]
MTRVEVSREHPRSSLTHKNKKYVLLTFPEYQRCSKIGHPRIVEDASLPMAELQQYLLNFLRRSRPSLSVLFFLHFFIFFFLVIRHRLLLSFSLLFTLCLFLLLLLLRHGWTWDYPPHSRHWN